jgi:selenoprotein W-related protein
MEAFKRKVSRFVLVPSDGGRFEVSVDGKPVWSKLETGEFPANRDVVRAVEKRLKGGDVRN